MFTDGLGGIATFGRRLSKTAHLLLQQLRDLRYCGPPTLLGIFTEAIKLFGGFGGYALGLQILFRIAMSPLN